jgi:hypothetical protein
MVDMGMFPSSFEQKGNNDSIVKVHFEVCAKKWPKILNRHQWSE